MRRRLTTLFALLLAATALVVAPVALAGGDAPPAQPTATGSGGAAASVDALATNAAIAELRRGGNAVDAAVTAAGVLGVVEPFSCGIGGGGFMVIRRADGTVTSIDSRETAPAAMTPTSFDGPDGTPLAFADARLSGLSVGVPGTVAAWQKALDQFGTISLAKALKPGIRMARTGFTIDDTFNGQVDDNKAAFAQVPSSAALYLTPQGEAKPVGAVQRNPDLAATYAELARHGASAFYDGPIAQSIVDAVTAPPVTAGAETWQPGVMTREDLRDYEALIREPTHSTFRGLDVYGMAPPSSGGTTVGEILNILDGTDLGGGDRTKALHLFQEASALAYADRGAYVGDPAYTAVPQTGLLSPAFAATRRALISPTATAPRPVAEGDPAPYDQGPQPGDVQLHTDVQPHGSTTHLTVADDAGNVVSYTFTIEQIGGNDVVVPGRGFLLNNELTDFDYTTPTGPNAVAGGKRPRSSMAPTIVERAGRPVLAIGSPGGATIITTVAQVLLDRLGLGTPLPAAIAAPRVSDRNGAKAEAEPGFIASPEGQALAGPFGHAYTSVDELGSIAAVEFGADGRPVLAASEPVRRGGGAAAVVHPAG